MQAQRPHQGLYFEKKTRSGDCGGGICIPSLAVSIISCFSTRAGKYLIGWKWHWKTTYTHTYYIYTWIWLLYCDPRKSLKFKHVLNGHGTVTKCKVLICFLFFFTFDWCNISPQNLNHFLMSCFQNVLKGLVSGNYWIQYSSNTVFFQTRCTFLEEYCTFWRSLWKVLSTLFPHTLKRTW